MAARFLTKGHYHLSTVVRLFLDHTAADPELILHHTWSLFYFSPLFRISRLFSYLLVIATQSNAFAYLDFISFVQSFVKHVFCVY